MNDFIQALGIFTYREYRKKYPVNDDTRIERRVVRSETIKLYYGGRVDVYQNVDVVWGEAASVTQYSATIERWESTKVGDVLLAFAEHINTVYILQRQSRRFE